MDTLTLAVLVSCGLAVPITLGFALVVGFFYWRVRARTSAWSEAGASLGLRAVRQRRRDEELGPGVAALMRGAILLGGWNRLVGRYAGREVELVLRGETGTLRGSAPTARAHGTPVRHDYTHARVARRGGEGFVLATRGDLETEVIAELGPPTAAVPSSGAGLVLWAHDPARARERLGRPDVARALAGLSGAHLCVNDRWVVAELSGAITDEAQLRWLVERAAALAVALDDRGAVHSPM